MVVPVCGSLLVGRLIPHAFMTQSPADPFKIAITHRCPKCEKSSLYQGYLTIKPSCESCGLDLREHDVGDGPAFFTITLLGFVVVGISFAAEIFFRPPYWMHGLILFAVMLALTPLCLRFFKSYFIAMKYKLHWSQTS